MIRVSSVRHAAHGSRGEPGSPTRAAWLVCVGCLVWSVSCAPVRPEQRAILADRIMQFGANARAQAALEHALENREGSLGGGSVRGGGCGCN
jgi:hypothetical protein